MTETSSMDSSVCTEAPKHRSFQGLFATLQHEEKRERATPENVQRLQRRKKRSKSLEEQVERDRTDIM